MYPDVLQRRPVHWTAAGGLQAGTAEGLLDEWGGFAPDARRPVLTPLIASEGGIWTAHQAQSLEHRLAGDGVPLPETVWRLPSGLALRIRAMPWPGTSPALAAVEYELRNESLMVQTGTRVGGASAAPAAGPRGRRTGPDLPPAANGLP
jgi:hypothetical protein